MARQSWRITKFFIIKEIPKALDFLFLLFLGPSFFSFEGGLEYPCFFLPPSLSLFMLQAFLFLMSASVRIPPTFCPHYLVFLLVFSFVSCPFMTNKNDYYHQIEGLYKSEFGISVFEHSCLLINILLFKKMAPIWP